MDNEKPFIYPFKTYNNNYIYDVNTNRILSLKEKEYKLLCNWLSSEDINDEHYDNLIKSNKVISKIISDGFLSAHRISEIIHPDNDIVEFYLDNRVNMIILQVTQQCNLRCLYCPYSVGYNNREHANKKMTFDLAKKGIDFLIKHTKDCDIIGICFYGGEPVLEFELVKKCIEYAEEVGEGKQLSFNMTTNGTLLSKEIIEYFDRHKVDLMISLDGPVNIHDKSRGFCDGRGTFETVIKNIDEIKKDFPEYFKDHLTFNCVLDVENDFGCINEFFTTYDVVCDGNINFSGLNDDHMIDRKVDPENYLCSYNYELFKLFLSKVGRLNPEKVSKIVESYYSNLRRRFFEERSSTKGSDKGHPGGPCIPGSQRLFMDVNGNFYPCERVSESSEIMKIGDIETGFDYDKVKQLLNIGKITEEKCKNCWAFRFCYLCASVADDMGKLSADKKLLKCKEVRNNTDKMFREYCILKEQGDMFEEFDLIGIQ